MKMTIGADLPADYQPSHDDLAQASAALIAHALLPLFAETLPQHAARANAQAVTTELAYLFDDGAIVMGGRRYRPRLAFIDEAGRALPGFEATDDLATHASDAFDIDAEAQVTFEAPEFDEG